MITYEALHKKLHAFIEQTGKNPDILYLGYFPYLGLNAELRSFYKNKIDLDYTIFRLDSWQGIEIFIVPSKDFIGFGLKNNREMLDVVRRLEKL